MRGGSDLASPQRIKISMVPPNDAISAQQSIVFGRAAKTMELEVATKNARACSGKFAPLEIVVWLGFLVRGEGSAVLLLEGL